MDPRHFSMRQLAWMADGYVEERWWHTSWLLSMIRATAFTKSKKDMSPHDFHPKYRGKKLRRPRTKEELTANLNAMVGLKEKHANRKRTTRR